jgi:DNA polymerase
MPLHIDFETRSVVDLKKHGVYVYAEHPTTDVWCMAWAISDGPVQIWIPGQPIPSELRAYLRSEGLIYAHNAAFERVIWRYISESKHSFPAISPERWRCTMAMAYAMALPGSLDAAAAALGLSYRKDMRGYRVMMQMCRPRRFDGDEPVWWDDEDKKQILYDYCKQDVVVERELLKRLVELDPAEQKVWHLDQAINDRGIGVDAALCQAAKKIVAAVQAKYDEAAEKLTAGMVTSATNVGQIVAFLQDNGVDASSVAKDQIVDLLTRDDLPEPVRDLLEIRQEAGKASVAKIDAMLAGRSKDGRARGLLQYHGAATGRWAGRRVQPQNLPRQDEDAPIDDWCDDILTGDANYFMALHDKPLSVISQCVRPMLVAGEGANLFAADFANIEGRVLAWLAGQEDKLDAFRAYDAGTGPDLYKVAAAGIYNIDIKQVTKPERQVGKVAELALGYQGGVGAFAKMAKGYGVDLLTCADAVLLTSNEETIEKANEAYAKRGKASGMDRTRWTTAELIKMNWRDSWPKIQRFWYDLEEAAVAAVADPGRAYTAGKIAYRMRGSFLWCRLPSGRLLCYPYARLETGDFGKSQVVYKGVDAFTRKWDDQKGYGGLFAENVTQAVARDIMVAAMWRLENYGYPVVLTVHDEIVCERRGGDLAEAMALMSKVPDWAAGCPIAVDGWTGRRYRK